MRLEIEDSRQLVIFTKAGPIHRPHFYIMHKSCGWQWEMLNRTRTGHWHMTVGRIVFTTV